MKKLSIAFIWHFHQPCYKALQDGLMLMPWARLHAVKDYLKMALYLEKFPGLKLNFDISPALIDTLEEYAKGGNDIHSRITLTPAAELTDDDKEFILNSFFDVDYNTVITRFPRYNELYAKRFRTENVDINDFTTEEYGDIAALFNLAWFNDSFYDVYPELALLVRTERDYNDAHRRAVIELQRKIIADIIPTFKKYVAQNRAEIMTSPYYNPILPLVADMSSAEKSGYRYPLPKNDVKMPDCAISQINEAIKKTKKTFGTKPCGLWPSELALSEEVLEYMSEAGIKWTVSDEGVLANSLKKEFVRDFNGYPEDPLNLCEAYSYECKNGKKINLIFRDSVIPNLLGTEYAGCSGKTAANDLYGRLKVICGKFQNSPHSHHLITIATDGENCFSGYADGGEEFLTELYSLITEDKSLSTVLVGDYLKKADHIHPLEHLEAGSCINRNFRFWTAEPTKNLAWEYLFEAYKYLKSLPHPSKNIKAAYKELCIAQGSDWFWWFGEPNDSGCDGLFDYLFREHLKNIYTLTGGEVPKYLEEPLALYTCKPSRTPRGFISPSMSGKKSAESEWANAGCIDIPDSPILQQHRLFNRIYFGCDVDNLYLQFNVNDFLSEMTAGKDAIYNIYIYFKTHGDEYRAMSPVRALNKTDNVCSLLKNGYTHELLLTFFGNEQMPMFFSKATKNNLWTTVRKNDVVSVYDETLEVKIPFDDLDTTPGEKADFFVINGTFGRVENVYPQDFLLAVNRPFQMQTEF